MLRNSIYMYLLALEISLEVAYCKATCTYMYKGSYIAHALRLVPFGSLRIQNMHFLLLGVYTYVWPYGSRCRFSGRGVPYIKMVNKECEETHQETLGMYVVYM
ncbi:hypothetical protein DFP73DRAFT_561354 [Morchella snyderi]|nr:hypothetical protein DFP73DRAFT_561354 [Morchella snyderi]